MSITWEQKSRTATYDRGRWTGSTTFLCYNADASITINELRQSAVLSFGGGADGTMANLMAFTGASFTPLDGSDKFWSATLNFESSLSIDGTNIETADILQEKQIGFTAIEVNAQSNIKEVWRTGATLPSTSAFKSAPELKDINGNRVDSAGDPISHVQGVLNISVRNVQIGRPNYLTYANTIGKRNSGAYVFAGTFGGASNLTCPAGSLLFDGATSSRIGPNQYEVNFSFTLDTATYHLVQVPLRNGDGTCVGAPKTSGTALSESNPWHATVVYWKQPFPDTDSFSGLGVVT